MADSPETFAKEIEIFQSRFKSAKGRKELFLSVSRERLREFDDAWRKQVGSKYKPQTFVDGREGLPLDQVRIPGGTIARRVMPVDAVVDRAMRLFDLHTRVVTGRRYRPFHRVYLNGAAGPFVNPNAKPGDKVDLVNVSDFAGVAEVRGYNDKNFPKGLMAGIAAILKKEYPPGLIPIRATWKDFGGGRLPAVSIG